MRNLHACAVLCLCAASIVSSCSKKTSAGPAQNTTAATGGKSAAAGRAGTAGTAGTAGAKATSSATGGMGAAGGPANMWSVPCGSVTCTDDYMVGMVCCVDASTSTCGVMSGTCQPRATPNPKCPGLTFPVTIPGCCLADGTTCGIDGYPVMPGCVSTDTLAQYMLPPPDPTHCDGTPIGSTAGAGGSNAGSGAGGAMGR